MIPEGLFTWIDYCAPIAGIVWITFALTMIYRHRHRNNVRKHGTAQR